MNGRSSVACYLGALEKCYARLCRKAAAHQHQASQVTTGLGLSSWAGKAASLAGLGSSGTQQEPSQQPPSTSSGGAASEGSSKDAAGSAVDLAAEPESAEVVGLTSMDEAPICGSPGFGLA